MPAEAEAIWARSDHLDRMDPPVRGLPSNMLSAELSQSGPALPPGSTISTALACIAGARPPSMGSGCTQSAMGGSGSGRESYYLLQGGPRCLGFGT